MLNSNKGMEMKIRFFECEVCHMAIEHPGDEPRELIGLTEDEVWDAFGAKEADSSDVNAVHVWRIYKAIEAKLREKNL